VTPESLSLRQNVTTDDTDIDDDIYTVTQLTETIKTAFKKNLSQQFVVGGEISNYKLSGSNLFFTLKDSNSALNVVMWDYGSAKNVVISNGKQVKVTGVLIIFSKNGSYNFKATSIEIIGVGNLHQKYLELKAFYTDAGYFDNSNKSILKGPLTKIGLLTAGGGAAIQDFIYVLNNNNFIGTVYFRDSIVQGKDCMMSIANGLKILDSMNLDVIVVARGGGSIEDLYGFSHEIVVDALYECKTTTISAIGHEIDFMLSDFVADIRAPTPSIAGELITSHQHKIHNTTQINELLLKLKHLIDKKTSRLKYDLININVTNPLLIITSYEADYVKQLNNLTNHINNKINNYNKILNSLIDIDLKVKPIDIPVPVVPNMQIIEQYVTIYSGTTSNKITTLEEFIDQTNYRKKLKLLFKDGSVTFDIRSIRSIKNNDTVEGVGK
jgi:exodeoxyribonuclease VII large subunit